MNKLKYILVAGLASASVCCCAQGLPWMTPKTAPAATEGGAGMQRLEGVLIERLDGQSFEKKDINGTKAHMAILPTPPGVNANVNVILDAQYGTSLPSMEEYARQTKEGYKSMFKCDVTIKEQSDDAMIFSASNDQFAFFVKVMRDAGNNRFIVVTGTIADQGGGANAQSELKGIAGKIERCVRSARKEGCGTGGTGAVMGSVMGMGTVTGAVTPTPQPTTSNPANDSMQDLDWVRIERFDGQSFEKKSENGTTMYYAKLEASAGLEAAVLILLDTQHGSSLPTMEQYAQASKKEFEQKGLETKIKEQDDASLIITASNNEGALFIKALKDVGNSRFVVVMGTIVAGSGGTNDSSGLKDVAGKVERCVRSARLK